MPNPSKDMRSSIIPNHRITWKSPRRQVSRDLQRTKAIFMATYRDQCTGTSMVRNIMSDSEDWMPGHHFSLQEVCHHCRIGGRFQIDADDSADAMAEEGLKTGKE